VEFLSVLLVLSRCAECSIRDTVCSSVSCCHRTGTVATSSKIVVQPLLDLHIIVESRIIFLFEVELNTVQQIEIRL